MIRALLLVLLLIATPADALRRTEANARPHSVLVAFTDGGHCTGTKIARDTVLIAAHCLAPQLAAVILDGTPAPVVGIVRGPGDQARIRVAADLGRHAALGDSPRQGDEVFIFGNPGDHRDQLRRGYISGTREDGLILAQLPVWKGDSGAAVFNERGQVVAVVIGIAGNEVYPVAVLQPLVAP